MSKPDFRDILYFVRQADLADEPKRKIELLRKARLIIDASVATLRKDASA